MSDEQDIDEGGASHRPPRLRNLARRIFREMDSDDRRESFEGNSGDGTGPAEGREQPHARNSSRGGERHRSDPWALLGALLETGDKAKTEMVRMLAREVRTYLEALELHKDLHHLLTNYSLEVNASFHLKPLADAVAPPSAEAPEGAEDDEERALDSAPETLDDNPEPSSRS